VNVGNRWIHLRIVSNDVETTGLSPMEGNLYDASKISAYKLLFKPFNNACMKQPGAGIP
jgi:hypothetical protein